MKTKRQIIAIGGGGFASEPENPALELYILAQARRRNPSVCFLGTATGDAATYVAKFYAAFSRHSCRPTHLPLFERTPNLEELILEQDVIYVGGGNTKSMLGVWCEWQLRSCSGRLGIKGPCWRESARAPFAGLRWE